MDTEVLAEKNGWLYICWISTDYQEPTRHLTYWPLKARFHDFAYRFHDEEEARAMIGCPMRSLGNGAFQDTRKYLTYRLPDGAQTKPEFTETEEVPEPKQRGKRLPVRWYDGHWQKETTRGWVTA